MNETAEYVWGDTFGTRLNSLHLSVQKGLAQTAGLDSSLQKSGHIM